MLRLKVWNQFVLVTLIMMSASALLAQAPSVPMVSGPALEPALAQLIKDHDAAQLHGDKAELERIAADDYIIVRPRGVGDKASLITNMAHAGMKLDPFTVLKPFTRNFGTTVVTGGWAELKGIDNGERFSEKLRFSDVWTKRNGRWFLVMTQLSPFDVP